ncbi:MAG: cysteine hydrolase [Atribacterota bacterium]|nr:cysteine hydrolase [Atribacterota bacterium]MDD4895816.1 cysteine hydrolase [Atribacterota bacterium]MDD5636863.1 cysteine hydrolase [Atribacterota bacterium]
MFSQTDVLGFAREAYEKGKADFKVDISSIALLVIDMQDEFVKPSWTPFWVPEATKQVPKIKKLIEHCRIIKAPVIYTAFADTHMGLDRPRSGSFMPNRYDKKLDNDNEWFKKGNIYDELKPLDNEVIIYKPSYGAFYDTPLDTILKNLNIESVIICGTLTNFCCSTTARQAYERGYKVIFGSDINSADDKKLHEVEVKVMRKGFAKVLNHLEIIVLLK